MPKKDRENDQFGDEMSEDGDLEFEQNDELNFAGDEDLLMDEESDDEDLIPSVLYKGVSRPKTEEDWRQLLMEAKAGGVPEYQLTDSYREGDLLHHTLFGPGVVSKVITPRKMEVVFETSKKLMAMNATLPSYAEA